MVGLGGGAVSCERGTPVNATRTVSLKQSSIFCRLTNHTWQVLLESHGFGKMSRLQDIDLFSSFRSFRFFELPTKVDTGTCSVERPCFPSDHIKAPCSPNFIRKARNMKPTLCADPNYLSHLLSLNTKPLCLKRKPLAMKSSP